MKTRTQESSGAVGPVKCVAGSPLPAARSNTQAGTHRVTRLTFTAMWLFSICFLFSAFSFRAVGQSYSIDWYKIAGGGGTSTGSVYSVSGTVGQPDASGEMTGGNYSLTGGFWSIYALQTPGAPLLTITYAGNQAVIAWPPSATGWTLQTNSNLGTSNWINYGGPIVNNSTTNAPPKGNLFFRLKQ